MVDNVLAEEDGVGEGVGAGSEDVESDGEEVDLISLTIGETINLDFSSWDFATGTSWNKTFSKSSEEGIAQYPT